MARKIIIKEDGLGGTAPDGYRYVGYDGTSFSEQVGATAASIGGSTPAYTVYTAKITQAGTASPTAVVQENTIGALVWGYDYTGGYSLTLSNAFPTEAKVWIMIGKSTGGTMDEPYGYWTTVNYITIEVMNQAGALTNDLLQDNPIEVRVYA